MKPLVSILTPCYNSEKYLARCIESVLAQDYPHIEMVIQDGGSTDGTVSILKRYADRVHWESRKDQGQSDGLNRALQRCRGEIIGVLNSDDEYLPGAVSWAVEQFSKDLEAAVIYGRQYNMDSEGCVVGASDGPNPYNFVKIFCCEEVIPAQAAFIRRASWKVVGFHVDVTRKTCPDYELWARLGLKFPMRYVPHFVARYRQHAGSEGFNPEIVDQMVFSKREVVDRICADLATPGFIRKLKQRAHGGILYWSVGHFLMMKRRDLDLKIRRRTLESLLVYPALRRLPKFLLAIPFPQVDWGEKGRVLVRRVRETGRRVDRALLFGWGYRGLYLPLKPFLAKIFSALNRSFRWCQAGFYSALTFSQREVRAFYQRRVLAGDERRSQKERSVARDLEWNRLASRSEAPGTQALWRKDINPQVPYGAGFHGDKYLVSLADFFLRQSTHFIETGTYLGVTAIHVAKNYPSLNVHTCEINRECVEFVKSKSRRYRNMNVQHARSPEFLHLLFQQFPRMKQECNTYWIDSHWEAYWPLQDEIEFLTKTIDKGFIWIDDFKIPGQPQFSYDAYAGRECSFEFIKGSLAQNKSYQLIYPHYSEKEATPVLQTLNKLVGTCAIVVGFDDGFSLPSELAARFSVHDFSVHTELEPTRS